MATEVQRQSPPPRVRRGVPTAFVAGLAGLAAAAAPVALTGNSALDVLERAALAALVTFVGAHGHRQSWLLAGALLAVPARGASLILVLAGLGLAVRAAAGHRRSKRRGAVAIGLMVNGMLWYPGVGSAALSPVLAIVACSVLVVSGFRELPSRRRAVVGYTLIATTVVAVLAVAGSGWAALSARGDVEAGTASAKTALAAVRRGDTERAQASLTAAQMHLGRAKTTLSGLTTGAAHVVPGLAQQLHAVDVAVDEGLAISGAADALVRTDYDSLRYDGRIDLTKVTDLQPRAAAVEDVLDRAEARLDALEDGWLVGPLSRRVDQFSSQVSSARHDASLADDLLHVVPGLLGGGGTRHYLVVFITPAELRGAGGFVGSYAELEATEGDVKLVRSGRVDDLLEAAPDGKRKILGFDEYQRRYGRFRPADFIQDTTYSPDWPTDAGVLAQLYPQSGGRPVDGVIAVDPTGMAALLKLTGPVKVEGVDTPFTSANAVEFLTRDQYLFFGDRARRGDIQAAATKATFQKLTDASLPAPRRLADALGPAARGRHLQLWSPTRAEQALFTRIDADGHVAIPRGQDGLAVISQNTGNNKIDAYLQREVTYRATVDARTGDVRATVRVVLHNNVPRGPLPSAVADNTRGLPVGSNVSRVSVYTPQVVAEASIDGAHLPTTPIRELGMHVWESPLVTVPAGGTVTLVLELRGGVDLRQGYHFSYLPQPVANPDAVTAQITVTHGHLTGGGRTLVHQGPTEDTVRLSGHVKR